MTKSTLIAAIGKPEVYTSTKGRQCKEVFVYTGCFIFDAGEKLTDDTPYFKGAFFHKSRKGLRLQGEIQLTRKQFHDTMESWTEVF